MTSIGRAIPLLATAALLAGCGSSSSYSNTPATSTATPAPSTPTPAATGTAVSSAAVKISNFKFVAPSVALKKGGTITFTNQDTAAHTATSDDGSSFDTGTLQQGQSKTITFKTAGTIKYHCVFHAFMVATVVVS